MYSRQTLLAAPLRLLALACRGLPRRFGTVWCSRQNTTADEQARQKGALIWIGVESVDSARVETIVHAIGMLGEIWKCNLAEDVASRDVVLNSEGHALKTGGTKSETASNARQGGAGHPQQADLRRLFV